MRRELSTIEEGGDEEEAGSPGHPRSPVLARSEMEEKVFAFYRQYNPTKLDSVPAILAKYKGRESELLNKLKKQYNVSQF